MIDIEDDVLDLMQKKMQAQAGERFFVLSDRTLKPKSYPAGFLEETENTVNAAASDTGGVEHTVFVTYRWTAASTKKNGKKSECKRIFAMGDEILLALGFSRRSRQPLYLNSATEIRLTGTYTAQVDENKRIIGGQDLGNEHL